MSEQNFSRNSTKSAADADNRITLYGTLISTQWISLGRDYDFCLQQQNQVKNLESVNPALKSDEYGLRWSGLGCFHADLATLHLSDNINTGHVI